MRDKILEKAGQMFLNYGFKSVTMDDIAGDLAISKKTLYKYFSNKSDLVDASIEAVQKAIDDTIMLIKEQKYNAIEEEFAVKKVFKEMFKNAKTSPMFQLKKYYPESYTNLIEREVCMFRDCNSDNLEKGIEQGLYRPEIKKELVTNFYFTLIFGIFDSDYYGERMDELMKVEYEVLEYHIRAIATKKGLEVLERELKNNTI
ncbi:MULTISPECIES: TetR/AcrR family transcriptional regulator [Tenacibaculum]|uniref:TetR/AcrR family transcriptional regulator n=1 Tax=Tenacibaculum aiptasiae TaxID=426481 RepID=A0A7J5AHY9_9FLAO|nr:MULTISPECIES: TetR/AcrR family transcriptional regulator [Tenacibaculum]KAB1157186.1 TetR/AcrR family transcriptional regulator [Tenacibaculum aiptasiae]MCF2873809.1 TetR/AcrR family transcriptional regulator [Tenacibaculum sp. Cn5-1]MCF2933965.1 TetR/AcrR family transcriptional regulator [Tenacibaculum sp. Cn5-34]MCG7509453.1 TetR/AcrR family transcriptional regulator [Tenacibaculum sp. Cn5-46]